jgi:hypothetical protein
MEVNPYANKSPQSANRPNNKEAKKTAQITTRKRASQEKTNSRSHTETPNRDNNGAQQHPYDPRESRTPPCG